MVKAMKLFAIALVSEYTIKSNVEIVRKCFESQFQSIDYLQRQFANDYNEHHIILIL